MTTQITEDSSGAPSWRIIAPLSMTVFFGMVFASALGPLVAEISDDMAVRVAFVGQINTIGLLMIGLAGLITGPLADHYGHRRSITNGLIIITALAVVFPCFMFAAAAIAARPSRASFLRLQRSH